MTSKKFQVVPSSTGGWDIVTTPKGKNVGHFDRKIEAVGQARELARASSTGLFIHKKDGTISEVSIYDQKPGSRVIRSSPIASRSKLKRKTIRKAAAKRTLIRKGSKG